MEIIDKKEKKNKLMKKTKNSHSLVRWGFQIIKFWLKFLFLKKPDFCIGF
jgi:hypothetical protein